MLVSVIKALVVGFVVGMPLGPVGILCIQKTLSKGRWNGFATGFGAALMDMLYAAISLFSLSFIGDFFESNRSWVMLVGGLIIIAVGMLIFFKNPSKDFNNPQDASSGHFTDSLQGFLITLGNPGALVLMLSLFAFAGIDTSAFDIKFSMLAMVGAVFVGECSWWMLVSGFVNRFRSRFSVRGLLMLNRIAGIVIALLGLFAFIKGMVGII